MFDLDKQVLLNSYFFPPKKPKDANTEPETSEWNKKNFDHSIFWLLCKSLCKTNAGEITQNLQF